LALLKKILSKFNGLHYSQEYLCFGKETFSQPPHAYLVGEREVIDITDRHCFTGYSPVIFALHSLQKDLPSDIHIVFSHKPLPPNGIFSSTDAIASFDLKKIYGQGIENDNIVYYEVTRARHHLVSSFHQFIQRLNNRLYGRKAGNVFLRGNLFIQVQAAYALPRTISLITAGEGGRFNLFPTDLHGPAGDNYYVISLRYAGKACRQVEMGRKILLSQVDADAYKTVYALGKNHMQELKPADQFPFTDIRSAKLQLPLPISTLNYRELEMQDHFRHGIHQLMLFKVLSNNPVTATGNSLAHIHNTYATWRDNNHLEGNYLLR
jgi:hypothetical protein